MNAALTVQFFLQLAVILVACRLLAPMAARAGQPLVVAEMLAGVILGPSLLGWLAPDLQAWLFPWDRTQATRDTQSYLFPISQLGLALYMFTVGVEFRVDVIAGRLSRPAAISAANLITPFLCGAALAWTLYGSTELFPGPTSLVESMLFLGAAMSVTALPVLARILHHKRLIGTTIGTVSLGAAAIGDAAAWILLAVVLAMADAGGTSASRAILGGAAYVALLFVGVGPALARWQHRIVRDGHLTEAGLAACLTLMVLGAWFTDVIGLHTVFGAFMVGAAMPRGVVADDLVRAIQPLCVTLLLPLFFAYSGLNTEMASLNTASLWIVCLVVLVVAVASKAIPCTLAAMTTGMPAREAAGVGVLMNARGLMELVIINIGLERGLISPELFAMLVIMTIVTTLMASPLFDRIVNRPMALPAAAASPLDSIS